MTEEIVIFENDNWKVTKTKGKNSGWIVGDCIGDNWIYYGNNRFGFDNPNRIPEYIKAKVRKLYTPKKKGSYTKEDVTFHSDSMYRKGNPAINVKVYNCPGSWQLADHFNISESDAEKLASLIWNELQFDFWEFAADELIENRLGKGIKFYTEGHSGGWLVVTNLPEFESWDAVDLMRWRGLENDVKNWIKTANTLENWIYLGSFYIDNDTLGE